MALSDRLYRAQVYSSWIVDSPTDGQYSPAKCALRQKETFDLWRHVISFVGAGILTEGGYQVHGPTRGPHRALRNPEPGVKRSAGSYLNILPC